MDCDVVIVGGGVSGLSCAHYMKKSSSHIKVKLIEAKNRLGGRVLGKEIQTIKGVETFDLGGQWVGRTQYHVMNLLKEFNLETYNQFNNGNTVNILDHGKTFLIGDILKMSITSLPMAFDLLRGLKKIDDMCKLISVDDPMLCSYAKEWDSMTMETAKQWLFTSDISRKLVDVGFLTVFGIESRRVSFLYVLLYIKCGGGCAALLDDTFVGNAQEFKVKGGMHQLIPKLVDSVGVDNIKLNSPVTTIRMTSDGCYITTSDGKVTSCKYIVIAIPPHLLANIDITPNLLYNHSNFLRHLNPGHLTKFVATYKERFWIAKGYSGTTLHWPYYDEADRLPVNMTYDATSSNGSPALVGFIGGNNVAELTELDDVEAKRRIIDSLTLLFGKEANNPIEVITQHWHKEPYNGGCPITFSSPGAISLYGDGCLRQPFHRLVFAGTESATIWRGFIDGAIQAGIRSAYEILTQLNLKKLPHRIVKYEDILVTNPSNFYTAPYYFLNGLRWISGISCFVGVLLLLQKLSRQSRFYNFLYQ